MYWIAALPKMNFRFPTVIQGGSTPRRRAFRMRVAEMPDAARKPCRV
jgi:hypothetical protein